MKHFFFPFFFIAALAALCISAKSRPAAVKNDRYTFWSVDDNGRVLQWWLAGDKVIGGELAGRVDSSSKQTCRGIAWCRVQGEDSSAIHLVMTSVTTGKTFISVLNGTEKNYLQLNNPGEFLNIGGGGAQLYLQSHGTSRNLLRWNGNGTDTLVTFSETEGFGCADIAVDSLGRAWFMICPWARRRDIDYPVDGGLLSLCCVTPGGKEVHRMPVSGFSSAEGAYGFILVNGTFYVAFTKGNGKFGNKLVPLVYKEGEMRPGKPLSFLYDGKHDLASRNPGVPVIPAE